MRPITTFATAVLTTGLFAAGCSDVGENEADHRANESVHAFQCTTMRPMADGTKHNLKFSVVGLSAPEFDEDFLWPDDEENVDCPGCPVAVEPERSDLEALNANGVVMRDDSKLILEGDADGFYWVTLALYKNSDYTKGYVRVEDGGGFVEEQYSEVHCTVTDVSAAPSGPDVSPIVGFYSNGDHEYEESGPLTVALYPAGASTPAGYHGHVDLARWDGDEFATTVESGLFKVAVDGDSYTLEVTTESGEPMGGGTWTIADRDLKVEGVEMYHLNQLSRERYIEQCYALEVLEYEFDEGFTPEEYPGVDVGIDDNGDYEVGIGATHFDASEADITVGVTESGDFEATVKTEWSNYVVRIGSENPRRGQVLFGDSEGGELQVMANIGCYE